MGDTECDAVEQELHRRRRHLSALFHKSHLGQAIRRTITFPPVDPYEFIARAEARGAHGGRRDHCRDSEFCSDGGTERIAGDAVDCSCSMHDPAPIRGAHGGIGSNGPTRSTEHARADCRHTGRDGDERSDRRGDNNTMTAIPCTHVCSVRQLYEMGPTPSPLMASLVTLVNRPNKKREENMRFRLQTEIRLDQHLGVQNPWVINTNMRFELGIQEDLKLHDLAQFMKLPLYSNACFRSLDIPIIYVIDGVECTTNAKIYASGTVVMIGVRPVARGAECAQKVVAAINRYGIKCSVNNLSVSNIVVGFDLGANLNLEKMAKRYPEQLNRYQYLPMYSYYPPGRKSPIAFLFRTGCGLIPGVCTVDEGRRFFLQIYNDAKPFCYHGSAIVDHESVEVVPNSIHQITGIDDMLRYLNSSDARIRQHGATSIERTELMSIMGALDGILDGEELDDIDDMGTEMDDSQTTRDASDGGMIMND